MTFWTVSAIIKVAIICKGGGKRDYTMNKNPNMSGLKHFTAETAKQAGRNGGINSGKSKRKKKKVAEYLEILLNLDMPESDAKEQLKKLGVEDENLSMEMYIAFATLMNTAQKGTVTELEKLRDLKGETAGTDDAVETDPFSVAVIELEQGGDSE